MKNFIFALTLVATCFFSFVASVQAGNTNAGLRIRTLSQDEAQYQLKNSSHWIEIKTPDSEDSLIFKLLDSSGMVQKSGVLKNGKALVDISDLRLGKYRVEIKIGETTESQNLEIL